jgi:hypothetical protein
MAWEKHIAQIRIGIDFDPLGLQLEAAVVEVSAEARLAFLEGFLLAPDRVQGLVEVGQGEGLEVGGKLVTLHSNILNQPILNWM